MQNSFKLLPDYQAALYQVISIRPSLLLATQIRIHEIATAEAARMVQQASGKLTSHRRIEKRLG